MSLSRNQEVLFKKPRCLNNQFYKAFAEEYNRLYAEGMIPKDIKVNLMKSLDCASTPYQNYLREARALGYITVSAKQTKQACDQRNSETFSRNLTKPVEEPTPAPTPEPLTLWQKIKALFGFGKQ